MIDSLLLMMASVRTHAMLVEAGVRPIALVMVRNEHIEECECFIRTKNLFMVSNPRGEDHVAVYIFKYPCMENVIDFTLDRPFNRKAFIQWVEGKMFGYSDDEIAKFIKENQ